MTEKIQLITGDTRQDTSSIVASNECRCCRCRDVTATEAFIAATNVSDGYEWVWLPDQNEWRDHLGRTPVVKGEKGHVIWCYYSDDWLAIAVYFR